LFITPADRTLWIGNATESAASEDNTTTNWQVFVGGIPDYLREEMLHFDTQVVGYVGCFSRLQIGDYQLELAKATTGISGWIDSLC